MSIDSLGEGEPLHDHHLVGVPHLEGVVCGGGSEETSVVRVPLHHRHSVGGAGGVVILRVPAVMAGRWW